MWSQPRWYNVKLILSYFLLVINELLIDAARTIKLRFPTTGGSAHPSPIAATENRFLSSCLFPPAGFERAPQFNLVLLPSSTSFFRAGMDGIPICGIRAQTLSELQIHTYTSGAFFYFIFISSISHYRRAVSSWILHRCSTSSNNIKKCI